MVDLRRRWLKQRRREVSEQQETCVWSSHALVVCGCLSAFRVCVFVNERSVCVTVCELCEYV